MIKKTLLVIILISTWSSCNSQTLKTIEQFENKHQDCLDTGINMKNCSAKYYNQSDSLLNIVYKKLKANLNSTEQTKLKNEQLYWLKKRDSYFKKAYLEAKNEGPFPEPDDLEMVYLDKKSNFIMDRVKELIARFSYR
ncbi:hypothetical protein GCM10022217_37640 [Chryseobacterium ginsenosidimutans]|uniref:lysozyme inhibitor LprI family protein n=1 Tax=Chryseobacterium ginsenosidimutans TaxID=687846 RepID=UPI0031DB57CB